MTLVVLVWLHDLVMAILISFFFFFPGSSEQNNHKFSVHPGVVHIRMKYLGQKNH